MSPAPRLPADLAALDAGFRAGALDDARLVAATARHGPWGHLLRGLALVRARRWLDARSEVRAALAAAPKDARVAEIAGFVLFVGRDHDRALRAWDHAARLAAGARTLAGGAHAVACLEHVVEAAGRLGWEQEMRTGLDRLLALDPGRLQWHERAARLYALRRLPEPALQHLERLLPHRPGDVALHLQVARLAVELGRTDRLHAAVAGATAEAPAEPGLRVQLADLLIDAGEFTAADGQLQAALAQDPEFALALAALARLAAWRDDRDAAADIAGRALAADPACGAARRVLGALALQAGERALALAHLDAALQADPRDAEAWFWRAEAELLAGDRDACHRDLDRGMLCADGFAFAAWLLRDLASLRGSTYTSPAPYSRFAEIAEGLASLCPDADAVLRRGDEREIDALIVRALTAMPGNRSTTPTFLADGRLQRLPVRTAPRHAARQILEWIRVWPPALVLEAFDALVARHPEAPLPACHRGELRLWLGDLDGARRDLEQAIALSPRTRWAWIGLSGCDLLQGDAEASLRTAAEGVAQLNHTEGPALFAYRGEALLRLGRLDEAVRDLGEACAQRPTRLGSWMDLALAHFGRDEPALGTAIFARLRHQAPGLLSDAGAELELSAWTTGDALPPVETQIRLLEHALAMMQGNRSSTCTTYLTRGGRLRAVLHHAAAATPAGAGTGWDVHARDAHDLTVAEDLLARAARVGRQRVET